ncbi:IF4E domain-containing protein [Rhizoctonia solani AG-1 IA]|uniref:IF4E domain-containing protein n=1 Tax=Thanatephorus cucumeris (strain AG1-IA) TaxID=983506 RepID=L8X273_THACA|nr:IF4E domain-containing protein [Rhizoctonia solani AG-1 IA]
MNITPPTNTTSGSSRPRLATSLLRTNSGTGTAAGGTGGSGTGPPSASSDKPTESQIPLPAVSISVSDPNGEEVKPSQPMPRGYKNVPSLDAIAGRLKAQKEKEKEQQEPSGKSGDESGSGAVELEQGEIEEVKGEVDTSVLHPLRHKWYVWIEGRERGSPPPPRTTGESPVPYTPSNTETGEYEAGLKVVGKFRTVEDFCRLFNWLKPPSKLERSSNYHMFKEDIKPMWEDPANANGGKWVITMRNNPVLLDRCWSWLAMGLVGQELDDREDMICGAVFVSPSTTRPKHYIIRPELYMHPKLYIMTFPKTKNPSFTIRSSHSLTPPANHIPSRLAPLADRPHPALDTTKRRRGARECDWEETRQAAGLGSGTRHSIGVPGEPRFSSMVWVWSRAQGEDVPVLDGLNTGCVAGMRFWTIWKAVMEFWFGGVLPVWMPVQSVGAEGEKGKERKEGTEKLKIQSVFPKR